VSPVIGGLTAEDLQPSTSAFVARLVSWSPVLQPSQYGSLFPCTTVGLGIASSWIALRNNDIFLAVLVFMHACNYDMYRVNMPCIPAYNVAFLRPLPR
jgi:hypothetical protein